MPSLRRVMVGASSALIVGGCWSLTTDVDDLSNGTPASLQQDGGPDSSRPTGDASLPRLPADAGTTDATTTTTTPPAARDAAPEDFCTVAKADAGGARFNRCDDYDTGSELSLASYGGGTVAAGPGDSRSAPNALAMFYPANPSGGCNGFQTVAVPFVANRIELSFDLRLERTRGKTSKIGNIGGFRRNDVYTYILIDYEADVLRVAEQDQRPGGTVNTARPGDVSVKLEDWHRVVFLVDFETGNATLSVIGGAVANDISLLLPRVDTPGTFHIGSTYNAENPEPIRYRYDNVVTRAW